MWDQTTYCFAVQDKVWVDLPRVTLGRSTPCSPMRLSRQVSPGTVGAAFPRWARPQPSRSVPLRSHLRLAAELPLERAALWRCLLAKLLGSAFLAAVVVGSGIVAQQLSPGNVGLQLLENAAAAAGELYAIILMFRPLSGGNFNPVVSFVVAAFGGVGWRTACAYLPVQLVGCIGGGDGRQPDVRQSGGHLLDSPPGHARTLPVGGGRHTRPDLDDLLRGAQRTLTECPCRTCIGNPCAVQ